MVIRFRPSTLNPRPQPCPLLVTGSLGIDTVETPAGKRDNIVGGSAIYFAYAASFFTPVRLVGVIGEDTPRKFFEVLRRFRKSTPPAWKIRRGSKTFRWHGSYVQDLNEAQTVAVDLNVLAEQATKKYPPILRTAATCFWPIRTRPCSRRCSPACRARSSSWPTR